MAMTLDGRIADSRGRSRWITSAPARRLVQELRRRSDAILVGAGTACADDPSLLPRPDGGRRPWRVVVDSRGRTPLKARIFTDDAAGRTIVATTPRCPPDTRAAWAKTGATVWICRDRAGRVSLSDLLRRLGRLGVLQVLCEGGGELAAVLLAEKRVDEAWFFMAPALLGGLHGRPVVGGPDRPLSRKMNLCVREVRRVGPDWLFRMRIDNRKG
jgi:diaminohydroxyphosphoribosylaminopyrimidine deaminase/5-amino-6-(5-phosphoribosylamino)uracil reductase